MPFSFMWQGVLGACTLILSVPSLAQVWVVEAELQGQLCDMAFDLSGLEFWRLVVHGLDFCVCVHVCACLCM